MPIYEYQCECNNRVEVLVPLGTGSQVCAVCGNVMQRVMSTSSFVMKPTGDDMALGTLNSKTNGITGRRKAWAEGMAAGGLRS